jgi:type IV pilus assembly protein PilY1
MFNQPGVAGAPIRMRIDGGTRDVVDPGDSHAGWGWLRADLGGHTFWWNGAWYNTWNSPVTETSFVPTPIRRVLEMYGLPGMAAGANNVSRLSYLAMRGNLDAAGVDWWKRTGLGAYFSGSFTRGRIVAGTNQLEIDRPNAFRPGDERYGARINVPGAGPAGSNLVAVPVSLSADGRTLFLDQPAATSVTDAWITVNLRVYDRDRAQCIRNCTISPNPTGGIPRAGGAGVTYTPDSTATCVQNGPLVETQTGACGGVTPPACPGLNAGGPVQTIARGDCYWTGRQSIFIEGVGTRYYGGTCVAQCQAAFPDATACIHGTVSPNYCGAPSAPSATISGTTYPFFNASANGQTGGCGAQVAVSNLNRWCWEREAGFNSANRCTYGRSCTSNSTSITESITTVPATDMAVVNRAEGTNYLVHDCLADNGTVGNPSNSFLNLSERRFGAGYNQSVGTAANGSQSYRATNPGGTAPPPIDVYSSNYLNWKFGPRGPNGHPIGRATRITLAKSALTDLVLTTSGVRFGLIVSNRTKSDLSNDGANVAFAARRMGTGPSDPDFANRQLLANAINNVEARSRTPLTEALYETMLYYAGRAPQWGTDTSAAWVGGTAAQGRDTTAVCSAVGPGCPAVGVYRSPMLANPTTAEPSSCQKNFVVLITNGQPEEDFSANSAIQALRYNSQSPQPVGLVSPVSGVDSFNPATASGQFIDTVTGQPYGLQDLAGTSVDGGYLWLDELAYFMRNADMSPGARITASDATTDQLTGFQGVITYVVGFRGANSPVLQQAAQRGDGLFYEATDALDLKNKLQQAVTNITSFSGTLAAATVPLASYNRSESGLDVYMSFFEPSANRTWRGTVKRYRLGLTQEECGTNADGTPNTFCFMGQTALSGTIRNIVLQEPLGTTGLITEVINSLAVSFWNPLTEVDGRDPARGGTGYQLLSQGSSYTPNTRKVYTKLSSTASNDLTAAANQLTVGNTAITTSLLGLAASDTVGRERLIKFIRGGNMAQASCNGASPGAACTTWAPWAHADALHSKVAQVYYNLGTTPPQQTLFYLTNDGLLHAVDANTGREQWAFLVEEALPQLQAMQINGNGEQIQAADGSPAVYVRDDNADGIINGSDQVILVFNLRRGGRSVYALDVTAPASPRFLWKITGDGGGQLCTGGSCASQPLYSELGQTWSAPVVTRVNGYANPVAIFGGGYDANQDNEPVTANDTMGRAVYVVDLLTGAPVRRLDSTSVANASGSMTHSIPSSPSVFDLNGDRKADVIYVGDTGGKLFRFQITDLDPSNWTGRLLARLSNATPANRKILFPPTVVPYTTGGSRVFAVFVGTGDREHPFKLNSADVIAMIVDRDVTNTLSSTPPVDFDSASLVKLAWDDQASQVSVTSSTDGWVRLLPPTVKVTESGNVQSDLLRVPVYGRASDMGFPVLTSTCTPSFFSRLVGYSGLESKIVVLPGSTSRSQLFQGNVAQNFIGAPQVLFLPDGRIVLFSSGGAAGIGAVQQIGQRNVARIRSYWYVDPN